MRVVAGTALEGQDSAPPGRVVGSNALLPDLNQYVGAQEAKALGRPIKYLLIGERNVSERCGCSGTSKLAHSFVPNLQTASPRVLERAAGQPPIHHTGKRC